MRLSWRARRRWALVVLLVGLPVYIALALVLVAQFDRPPVLLELAIYVALGIIWALPFRAVFSGVGRAEAEAEKREAVPDEPPGG
jgi:predicted permease